MDENCFVPRNEKKMANVKNLKKDINYVLGDIIEAVYLFEISTTGNPTPATNALIDEAITTFDGLITKVNAKNVENKKAHFKQIGKDLEAAANELVAKINELN
jgi:GTPase